MVLQIAVIGLKTPNEVASILCGCYILSKCGHDKAAFTSLLTTCLPPVRRCLTRGEEVLPQFITCADFAHSMSFHGQQREDETEFEEKVRLSPYLFNRVLQKAHYLESTHQIRPGNGAKLKQAVLVCGQRASAALPLPW